MKAMEDAVGGVNIKRWREELVVLPKCFPSG